VTSLIYKLLVFGLVLTGFAQMPIFKRYYIADIPGLEWLGAFYVTHAIHYILAAAFCVLVGYALIPRLVRMRITAGGALRLAIVGVIIVTGILRVLKNMQGVSFSPALVQTIDLTHLGAVMVYGVAALGLWIAKRSAWFAPAGRRL
jgi:hypothetical protein